MSKGFKRFFHLGCVVAEPLPEMLLMVSLGPNSMARTTKAGTAAGGCWEPVVALPPSSSPAAVSSRSRLPDKDSNRRTKRAFTFPF